jgi:protein CpxP
MFLRKGLLAAAGLILAGGMGAFASTVQAQQTQSQTPPSGEGLSEKERIELRERRGERMRHRQEMRGDRDVMREGRSERLSELNLSDEQRKQRQAIIERRLAGTKQQREELMRLREKRIAGSFSEEDRARAEALKQEMRTAMQGVREEMESVLTAEQKTKLEQLKAERKQRQELRMKERQERRQNKPTIL